MSRCDSEPFLSVLYGTATGRVALKLISAPFVSKAAGAYASSGLSKIHIKRFIDKYAIDLDEYEAADYKSFNDFFTRKIKPERRPVDRLPSSLISPCDGALSAYRITSGLVMRVKGNEYTMSGLLWNSALARNYSEGTALILRLCVSDYHRYCYVDGGIKEDNIHIPGVLHTVRPVALANEPVFIQNSREYTVIHTDNFGDVVQMEVGALLVGKIENYRGRGRCERGEEKGKFLYGGSTIIVLLQKNAADIPEEYFAQTEAGREIPVKLGQKIAESRVTAGYRDR